jgi:hypothetical protein
VALRDRKRGEPRRSFDQLHDPVRAALMVNQAAWPEFRDSQEPGALQKSGALSLSRDEGIERQPREVVARQEALGCRATPLIHAFLVEQLDAKVDVVSTSQGTSVRSHTPFSRRRRTSGRHQFSGMPDHRGWTVELLFKSRAGREFIEPQRRPRGSDHDADVRPSVAAIRRPPGAADGAARRQDHRRRPPRQCSVRPVPMKPRPG